MKGDVICATRSTRVTARWRWTAKRAGPVTHVRHAAVEVVNHEHGLVARLHSDLFLLGQCASREEAGSAAPSASSGVALGGRLPGRGADPPHAHANALRTHPCDGDAERVVSALLADGRVSPDLLGRDDRQALLRAAEKARVHEVIDLCSSLQRAQATHELGGGAAGQYAASQHPDDAAVRQKA
jgi:hypothetical protein